MIGDGCYLWALTCPSFLSGISYRRNSGLQYTLCTQSQGCRPLLAKVLSRVPASPEYPVQIGGNIKNGGWE